MILYYKIIYKIVYLILFCALNLFIEFIKFSDFLVYFLSNNLDNFIFIYLMPSIFTLIYFSPLLFFFHFHLIFKFFIFFKESIL